MFKKIHIFRVMPDQELHQAIENYCDEHGITSAAVIGIIGSLKDARLNFLEALPGKYTSIDYAGPLEIVCAQGSIARQEESTIIHIHIQLSNPEYCWGGHLVEATVFSTAEVALGELDYQLKRKADAYTGLNELFA